MVGQKASYTYSSCKFPVVYMCKKLWKLGGSRQSYCKNYQVYFFGPPCITIATSWRTLKTLN